MCGIFAYTGKRSAEPLLLDGLRTLEYRGYDSAGIYIPGNNVVKAVGPIKNLSEKLTAALDGTSGIAHTRWATHGGPTLENAHPHCDYSESLWVVHNGIIDNWRELKEGLQQQGIQFYSDTDTEVLAKLLGANYTGNLQETLQATLPLIRGTYGLVAMHESAPEEIYTARLGSPIVIGIGTDGYIVSSDPSALLVHTKDVLYLDDGDIARITPESHELFSLYSSSAPTRRQERIEWERESVQKEGFDHFMLKEICEAPRVVTNTLRGRLMPETGRVKLGGLESVLPQLLNIIDIRIVGCGSAYYAGEAGKYLLESYAHIPTQASIASEYRYQTALPSPEQVVIAVSQSGETADTLAAIHKARENNQLTLGVINVVGSSITRATHAGVHNHAGPEIAVASTKAFVSQLVVMVLLTVAFGRDRDMPLDEAQEILSELEKLPQLIEEILNAKEQIQAAGEWLAQYDNALFLGRHAHAPIASEGALKLKEVSYIHAEGYPGGELKHGPLALLGADCPVVALAPHDHVYEKMCSNIHEVQARNAPLLSIVTDDIEHKDLQAISAHIIRIPKTHPAIQPILSTIPLHLLAYYVGVARGLDVDKPRNLAKSVTVE